MVCSKALLLKPPPTSQVELLHKKKIDKDKNAIRHLPVISKSIHTKGSFTFLGGLTGGGFCTSSLSISSPAPSRAANLLEEDVLQVLVLLPPSRSAILPFLLLRNKSPLFLLPNRNGFDNNRVLLAVVFAAPLGQYFITKRSYPNDVVRRRRFGNYQRVSESLEILIERAMISFSF